MTALNRLFAKCLFLLLVGCITKNLPDGAIELSGKIDETSGLAFFQNQFYTLNDSGGKAALYAFDKNGKLLEKHKIEGAINRDWEDIAQDSTHFYIADTGNNFATRKDLTIYKVTTDFQLVDSIKINYSSQTQFKKKKKNKYDAETLVAYGDSLLIFLKIVNLKKLNSMLSQKKEEGTH